MGRLFLRIEETGGIFSTETSDFAIAFWCRLWYDSFAFKHSGLAWRHKNAVRVFVWWVMIERVMNTTTRWRTAFYLGAAQSGFAEQKPRQTSAQSR